MYELERQAQDDPLLMDLLMGMESATETTHKANLLAIERQIDRRVKQGQRKKRSYWKFSAMAAAILLLLAAGSLWLWQMPQEKKLIVSSEVTEDKIPELDSPVAYVDSPPAVAELKKRPSKPKSTVERSTDDRGSEKAKAESQSIQIAQAPTTVHKNDRNEELSEISISPSKRRDTMSNLLAVRGARSAAIRAMPVAETPLLVKGLVVDKVTKEPLAGATVQSLHDLRSASTDGEGRFSMPISRRDTLNIRYIGYEQASAVVGTDSVMIAMQPSSARLNELVAAKASIDTVETLISGRVAGIQTDQKPRNPTKKPEPVIGWDAYRTYLQAEALTEGDEATIVLTFQVDEDGTPKHIRIANGANEQLNKRAVSIVTNGPKWFVGTATNKVEMKIKFNKR